MVEIGKRPADDSAADEPAQKHYRGHDYASPALDPDVQARLDAIYADGLVVEGDIDGRALAQLAAVPVDVALEVLEEFASSEMDRVRNKSAFLSGILNRFRKYGGNARLHPEIQARLDQLFKRGALQPGQLDARCLDALQTLSLHIALRAIDRFSSRDLSEIRNVSAFFMSNVKAAVHGTDDEEQQYDYAPPPAHALLVQPPPPPPPRYRPAAVAQGGPGGLDGGRGTMDAVVGTPTGMVPAGPLHVAAAPNTAKRSYAIDQTKLGVRVDEFHGLSIFAVYVHPAPALKLQQLWDDGNPLVSLLDDPSWSALSDLGAPEALAVIEETAAILNPQNPQDNISAIFLSIAQRYMPRLRPMVNATVAAPSTLTPFMPHEPGRMPGTLAQSGYNDDTFSNNTYSNNTYPSNGYRGPNRGGGSGGGDNHYGRKPRTDVFRDRDRERGPGNLADLPLAVQQKIEEVLQSQPHYIGRHHFDEGVVDSLRRLAQSNAISVMEELEGNDLATVRNVPAYIMGICKRYQQHRGDVGYIPPQQRV